ncbi:MAG TPA: hypothetical protein VM680_01120 [Verrucomicrobiae bacterium]|nr:hypothetical protein [Verrucomicrobiae bacterium]
MKTMLRSLSVGAALSLAAVSSFAINWSANFKEGAPNFKSIGQLAFGPDGILFAADSKAAAVIAIDTADTAPGKGQPMKVEGINHKVAALLGTKAEEIVINDLAVNPISHKGYLSVSRGRGPEAQPALIRVDTSGNLELVGLDKVKFSRAELTDAPMDKIVGEGNRQSNPRMESITDVAYLDGKVLVAGLSNEEFASTLRTIPFPFAEIKNGASVEIYHGAHGRFETRAPIRTFVPFNVGNEPQLLAAYTCTPLVQLPLKELAAGSKVKGKTVAELGNMNRPLDMIVYQKGGKDYLLLANSARGIMKVSTDKIEEAENITEPVRGGGSKGLTYETIKGVSGVEQLASFDANNALVVRKTDDGQNLEALPLP